MVEDLLTKSISMLAEHLKRRIESYGERFLFLSQEYLITFLYAYSIIQHKNDLLDKIFIDYPFTKQSGSRGKFDVYIDVKPGYYIEVKYVRPIPSGMNLPLPQHRGALINDLIRLAYKTPPETNKYLLLVASSEFITHISNKPGLPINNRSWHGKIRDLIVTATEDKQISKENRTYLDQEIVLQLLKHELAHPLHIVTWKVLVPID